MMKKTINNTRLGEYARNFANKVCSGFFAQKERASGNDLKKLTPSSQLNMQLIKLLFLRWQTETAKLESPFFDFESPEVQAALKEFMNFLSKNISVGPEAAENLLADAVEETLLLALDMPAYFERMFGEGPTCRPAERADEAAKYVRFRKPVYEEISRLLHENHPEETSVAEALATVRTVTEKHDFTNDAEALSADLNRFLAFNTADFFVDNRPVEEAVIDSPEIFEVNDADFEPEPDFLSDTDFLTEEPVAPPIETEEPAAIVEDDFIELKYPLGQPKEEAKPTRTSFRDKITLEEKFTFTNDLFLGDVKEFEEALDKIDAATDYHEAIMVIKMNYFRKHGWNLQSDPVKSFYEILGECF